MMYGDLAHEIFSEPWRMVAGMVAWWGVIVCAFAFLVTVAAICRMYCLLLVTFTLLSVTPSYGQEDGATPSQVSEIINTGLGGIFCSELLVNDRARRASTAA